MQGPPSLAAMRWWTSRGKLASERRTNTTSLLAQCARAWGRRALHVFDRGYAGAPWLNQLTHHRVRFIIRWPARYHLTGVKGNRNAWRITQGKRSMDHRLLWEAHRREYRKTGIVFAPVRHPRWKNSFGSLFPGRGRDAVPGAC